MVIQHGRIDFFWVVGKNRKIMENMFALENYDFEPKVMVDGR